MASKTDQEKLPIPPRARSVPLLHKSTSLEPLSPILRAPRKSPMDFNKTMPSIRSSTSLLNSSGPVTFGTPSYPSPLDRIRTSKRNLVSNVDLSQSMPDQKQLMNRSLPEIQREIDRESDRIQEDPRENEGQWTGNSLHSFSFAAMPYKGSFCNIPNSDSNKLQVSMSASWQFFNYIGEVGVTTAAPTVIRNPNKAVITFNARTSEILVANDVACDMFAYTHEELIGMKMAKMFTKHGEAKQEALVEQHIEENGAVVMVSGKVLEAVDSNDVVFPVSVWMKKVTWDKEPRCIAVLEPVERITAQVVFDRQGTLLECDQQLSNLHGFSTPSELIGKNMKDIIPSLLLPNSGEPVNKNVKKQQATGRTKDGAAFPLSISIKELNETSYKGLVWVFTNISGLVSVLPNGNIYSCNKNFALMLFGYSDNELVGKPITHLVPAFYDYMDLVDDGSMPFPPMDEDDELECYANLEAAQTGRSIIPQETSIVYSREIDSRESSKSTGEIDHLGILPQHRPCDVDSTRATLGDSSPSTLSLNSLLNDANEEDEKIEGRQAFLEDPEETGDVVNGTLGEKEEGKDISEDRVPSEGRVFEDIREQRSDTLVEDVTSEEDARGQESSEAYNNIDSVISCGAREDIILGKDHGIILNKDHDHIILDKFLESTEDPLAVSSPVDVLGYGKDNDSGVYTSEDLFRDMLARHGKDVNDLKAESTSSDTASSGQRSTLVKPSCPRSDALTSTPNMSSAGGTPDLQSPVQPICEGLFVGQAQHKDGSSLGLLFQIKKVELKNGQVLFCIWISKDPEDEGEVGVQTNLGASHNSVLLSSVGGIKELNQSMNDLNIKEGVSPGRGRYDERYLTLHSMGKGAFGFVKLATRRCDNKEVVVKFIRKDKVLKDSWRDDPVLGTVPFEIALLAKLKHPNVVKLMDAFENEDFFQLVMEKHGSGMDLFDFIDRQPNMDEALASYLFRQVVDAVSYLHSQNILHRDVKDENVILDELFHVKLIDFGSAATMEEGKVFSTFCGTMEYCSPEVLLGNKYKGPELEIWSMGVTLYTLIFGENPFYDVEETIRSELHPPFAVSQDLMFLICWMLHPDPQYRVTMQDLHENSWLTQQIDIESYTFASIVGGVDGDLQDIFDEGRDEERAVAAEAEQRCYLQAAYQSYLESVDDDDEEK